MDEREFARRIEVYLEVDMPDVSGRKEIAEALSRRLFQYLPRGEGASSDHSQTIDELLPDDEVLVFTAAWDGNSVGYADLVREAVGSSSRRVIEIDVDDPVGGAIARHYRVLNTPAVVSVGGPAGSLIVGRRTVADLRGALSTSP